MIAGGPMALSAFFLAQASAHIEAGARLDCRAGEAPIGPGEASQGIWMNAITPSIGFMLRTSDNELGTSYAPRFLWSVPNSNDPLRPLILQTFVLTNTYRPSKRSQWQTSLRAVYGQEDSVALQQLLPGQATLPAMMKIFSGSAEATASWRSTRLTTLTFQLAALHRRPLDYQSCPVTPATGTATTSGATPFVFPTQTTLRATPALQYTSSRRSHLEFSVPVGYYDSSANGGPTSVGKFLVVQPQVAWVDDLSRRNQLSLAAGISVEDVIARPANYQGSNPITPIVRTGLNSILVSTRTFVLRSELSAQVSLYLDPVLGTTVLRAPFLARLDATMGRHWSAGALVNFTTDASWSPLPCTPSSTARNGGCPDETVFLASIPVRYTWAQLFFVEFAGRFAIRAPHLRVPAEDFHWGETEIWATLTLSAASRFSWGPSSAARVPREPKTR
jgi:hypothetical protein